MSQKVRLKTEAKPPSRPRAGQATVPPNRRQGPQKRSPARERHPHMEGSQPPATESTPKGIRLHKALAGAGVASRRHAEELIQAGRVSVNGEVVRQMGVVVDPARDRIAVDGRKVQAASRHTYLMLHKPRNVLTTVSDPRGRPTVMGYLPHDGSIPRVYPVGRLDNESEGLVLLTDDGELANRLMHPRFQHEKEYRVLVEGRPSRDALDRIKRGVRLDDGLTAPADVGLIEHIEGNTWLRIVLREGRKRQIRRMLEAVGYRVKRLIRVRIGGVPLGDLPPGAWRRLTAEEVAELRKS